MWVRIFKYGASVLRKKADEITKDDNLTELACSLFETMKRFEGIGLAAPQIGISKRAFVIDTAPLEDDDIAPFQQIYFNPEITWSSPDQSYYSEGCLSIPNIYEDVLRPASIRVKYLDANLIEKEELLEGMPARIFQHENDHLNGILFTDKLSPLKRKLLTPKLNRIAKQ